MKGSLMDLKQGLRKTVLEGFLSEQWKKSSVGAYLEGLNRQTLEYYLIYLPNKECSFPKLELFG